MELIKFTLNDWWAGEDYPDSEPYTTWLDANEIVNYLGNDKWCKENKLSVVIGMVDMSLDACIIAPKEWVEKNCKDIVGSEFELPIAARTNRYCTPFTPDYEKYIGCYLYDDDWDYDNKCYKNPYIIHMYSWGKTDGEKISVKDIVC